MVNKVPANQTETIQTYQIHEAALAQLLFERPDNSVIVDIDALAKRIGAKGYQLRAHPLNDGRTLITVEGVDNEPEGMREGVIYLETPNGSA